MKNEVTFTEKTKWATAQKVFHALEKIDQYYQYYNGEVYIAFSGGKDSSLLKWLCDKYTDSLGVPRIKCVFNNTTNELREILEFVKSFGEEVTWIRPKITFAQSLLINGYPLISKAQAQYIKEAKNTKSDTLRELRLNGRYVEQEDGTIKHYPHISKKWKYLVEDDIKITDKCCEVLKKSPARKFEKETGLKPIIGVTFDESSLRALTAQRQNECNTYGKRPVSKPLNIFTQEDVWTVILENNVPYCKDVYDDKIVEGELIKGLSRTGCAYCAFGAHLETEDESRFRRLYQTDTSRYKSMMDKLGYRQALHKIGIKLPDD